MYKNLLLMKYFQLSYILIIEIHENCKQCVQIIDKLIGIKYDKHRVFNLYYLQILGRVLNMFILDDIMRCSIDIDPIVPAFTSMLVDAVKIIVPLLLIVYGMIDLAKAVMSNDEKTMKEAQGKLVKRFIYALIIFFIVALVQLVFGMLAKASSGEINKNDIVSCINCFMSNDNCARAKTEGE